MDWLKFFREITGNQWTSVGWSLDFHHGNVGFIPQRGALLRKNNIVGKTSMGPRLHHVVYICRCLYIYIHIYIDMYIYINSIYIWYYICIYYHLITGMNHVSTMDDKIRHCNDSICASHSFFNHVMCCCSHGHPQLG
jgi:hypothetical protein